MKLQATIVISYRADSFGDAGDALDDLLQRAREREDGEIDSIARYSGPDLPPLGPPPPSAVRTLIGVLVLEGAVSCLCTTVRPR